MREGGISKKNEKEVREGLGVGERGRGGKGEDERKHI